MDVLKSQIESLLFISAKPMSVKQLSDLIKQEEAVLKAACEELVEEYRRNGRGIQIINNGSKFQMVSSSENTALIQEFIRDETTGELSRPSLETLTIIAYRGPIRKSDLDRIRGVNCSLILRNLLIRGLIEAKPGQDKEEQFYSVTFDFIRFLGINDLSELPDYERLRQNEAIDNFLSANKAGVEGAESAEAAENEEAEENMESGQTEVSVDNSEENMVDEEEYDDEEDEDGDDDDEDDDEEESEESEAEGAEEIVVVIESEGESRNSN